MTVETELLAPVEAASQWLDTFGSAVEGADFEALENLFSAEGWWRDLLALTWDFSTFHGRAQIREGLEGRLETAGLRDLHLSPGLPLDETNGVITAFFEFSTGLALGRGVVRLQYINGEWKAWTLLTAMSELVGHEERHEIHDQPPIDDVDPEVLVIGAGHSGLTAAARLMRMGLSVLVAEKLPRVGDVWRNRYGNLTLHDTKEYGQFPFLAFPKGWPTFASKKLVADFMESYARTLQIPVLTACTVEKAAYDDVTGRWTVTVSTDGDQRVIHPKHLVFATGNFAGRKPLPELPGANAFTGKILHSQDYDGDKPLKDQRVVVVGTGSSGHDVARDAYEMGAEVTLVQRGPTYVMSQERGVPALFDSLYSEDGLPVEDADLISLSMPWPLFLETAGPSVEAVADLDKELLSGLEAAGFATTLGPNGSRTGLPGFALSRGGGYYIDSGCSQLIVDRKIRIQRGEITRFSEDSVEYSDGSKQTADMVVFATGWPNAQETLRPIVGDEVADKVGLIYGLGDDGEIRVSYRPTAQRGLWVMAGNFQQSRWGSKMLALQIKARELGLVR